MKQNVVRIVALMTIFSACTITEPDKGDKSRSGTSTEADTISDESDTDPLGSGAEEDLSAWTGPGEGRCEGGRALLIEDGSRINGIEACPDQSLHRYEAVNCGPIPNYAGIGPDAFISCGECSDGEICLPTGFINPRCEHLCSSDVDCSEDEVCLCAFAEAGGRYGFSNLYSKCVPAACRTDADCAPYRCGIVISRCGAAIRLDCHTEDDDCEGTRQCPDSDYAFYPLCSTVNIKDSPRWMCTTDALCD